MKKILPKKITENQRGVALIMALLVIAIVAAIAADLVSRLQIDIRRTDLVLSAEQADLAATYSVAWAKQIYLNQPKPANPTDIIPIKLPLIMPTYKIGNITIDAVLSSAQGRFNINNLTDQNYIPLFARLIQLADPDTTAELSLTHAKDIAYFINSAIDPVTDQIYATFIPPYRPPHRMLASPSEIRAVKDISPRLYQRLMPFIIALPTATPVDPSSASKILLISYGVSDVGADAVVNYFQNQNTLKNINEFYTLARFQAASGGGAALFDIQSQFYLLVTTLKSGSINWVIYSILQADKTNGKLVLLQQTRNTL